MIRFVIAFSLWLWPLGAIGEPGPLQQKIESFLGKSGKKVDFNARRPLVEMENQSNGRGDYIAKWDNTLGAVPTAADGFTDYELHRIKK
jgi:hypothetical protein